MALTPSTMMPLGTPAPGFALPDTSGRVHDLAEAADAAAVLIVFMCNHCPFVKHIREALATLGNHCRSRGVAMFGINSNDITTHPSDRPELMAREAETWGYTFPYLVDESQEVAKAYRAACTPDFYLFDGEQRLVYRGQLDDSRPGNGLPVTGADLHAAIDAVVAGRPVAEVQTPSIGCNIKWKPGDEPEYFG